MLLLRILVKDYFSMKSVLLSQRSRSATSLFRSTKDDRKTQLETNTLHNPDRDSPTDNREGMHPTPHYFQSNYMKRRKAQIFSKQPPALRPEVTKLEWELVKMVCHLLKSVNILSWSCGVHICDCVITLWFETTAPAEILWVIVFLEI